MGQAPGGTEARHFAGISALLLSIEFTDSDRERIGYLAERSSSGTLTPDEEAEYDSYLHVANVLAIMQSKARVVLGEKPLTHVPGF